MRVLAVLTVRNEGAFLLEWLAHHRAAGFTDFLVFSNNCQDGTDRILDRLQELGHLTHLPNEGPYDKRGIQFTALKAAGKHKLVKQADWILPLDVDEFINVHTGQGRVTDLIAALPDATAITLTWRLFGNAETIRYEDAPVTQSFTRCAPAVMFWPWRASMFKTLYRNDGIYSKLGVHRPRNPDLERLDAARWFDANGRELDEQFKLKRLFSNYGRDNYQLAQLNHYPLGAMESYVLKADRGRAVHSEHMLDVDYWVERNFNTDTDETIHRYDEKSTQLRDELHADPTLAKLHKRAVDWRRNRFQKLMEQEPYRALLARLMMTPPSRPISAATARTLTGFANLGRLRAKSQQSGNDPKPT